MDDDDGIDDDGDDIDDRLMIDMKYCFVFVEICCVLAQSNENPTSLPLEMDGRREL